VILNSLTQKLEAESPDEEAFVQSAIDADWKFQSTLTSGSTTTTTVRVAGVDKRYTVVAVNRFSSKRKRMSIIVQKENKQHMLLIKGADNTMDVECVKGELSQEMRKKLVNFSIKGLRTMVIGSKTLTDVDVEDWLARYSHAQKTMEGRDEKLENLAAEIEKDVTVLGATAIKDELQDEVGETIQSVREAGIKLWVLTGDKLETAISIGYSTRVLDPKQNIMIVTGQHERFTKLKAPGRGLHYLKLSEIEIPVETNSALIITGEAVLTSLKTRNTKKSSLLSQRISRW